MKVKIENGELVISCPLEEPRPSATGKTLIVASSHGNVITAATIDGKPIVIGLNAYVYAKPKPGGPIVKAELAGTVTGS